MDLKDIFYISEKDWYKLQGWATIAYEEDKNEISGLMTAVPQKDGRIKISDVEILKQENSATNTELDGDAVAQYTMKYAMKYNNPDMKFVWWHSHHTMGAFWSGTDENEIKAWKNTSYSLALVINLAEEYKFRVSFWQMNGLPIEQHVDTNLTIERNKPKVNITDAMKNQYKELCEERTVVNKWVNHHNGYIKYGNHINQTNIWQQEENLNNESQYSKFLEDAESIQESFLDGTIQLKDFRESLEIINKECKDKKLPFNIKKEFLKLKKAKLHQKLMEVFPNEFFEFEDNIVKDKLEQAALYQGGWYGV
tara:strand:+ start:8 stop:934 length:927 start_codon:yes stop_codon:yes gene_type:complete